MLKAPALLPSRYSFTTSFLYSRTSTRRHFRRHFEPSLSPGVALPRASSFFTHNSDQAQMESESYAFGPYKINPSEVLYSTQLFMLWSICALFFLMCLYVQDAVLSVSLILQLMRLVTYGLRLRKSGASLRPIIRHLHSHLQSKMGRRLDKLFRMFIFTYSHAKVVILRKMTRFMMLLM